MRPRYLCRIYTGVEARELEQRVQETMNAMADDGYEVKASSITTEPGQPIAILVVYELYEAEG